MSETRKKHTRRPQQTYKHRTNALHFTLYDPQGQTIPAEVRHQVEETLTNYALQHNLLVGIATT